MILREPTEVDFESVKDIVRLTNNGREIERFHVIDFEDFAMRVDISDRKRDTSIFHPKIKALRVLEDEKHGMI